MTQTIHRRFVPVHSHGVRTMKRSDDSDGDQLPQIGGRAAVFFDPEDRDGTEYPLWRDTFERIMPGAFDEIAADDVRALQNHDPRLLLGRSTAGTLALEVTDGGLDYLIDTPDTTVGRDTVVSLDRGDISGSSFAFHVVRASWKEEEGSDGVVWYREIEQVRTFDVGPVTYPAYSGTDSGTRGARSAVGVMSIDRRDTDHELNEIRASLQNHIREHYHEPQRRDRERALQLLNLPC